MSLPEILVNIIGCDIIGGIDGIVIKEGVSAAAVTIQETTIKMAQNRGVVSLVLIGEALKELVNGILLATMISSLAICYRHTNTVSD